MIDNRPGSGYQILKRWRYQGSDGAVHEVTLTAFTLLPPRPGPIPKRYRVSHGRPTADLLDRPRRDGGSGDYDSYSEALAAAERLVRASQDERE